MGVSLSKGQRISLAKEGGKTKRDVTKKEHDPAFYREVEEKVKEFDLRITPRRRNHTISSDSAMKPESA